MKRHFEISPTYCALLTGKLPPVVAVAWILGSVAAESALVVTRAEDSKAYNSTLNNTRVLDFNSYTTEADYSNITWQHESATVGTIDQLRIMDPDQYGGAGSSGSFYAAQFGNSVTTLTLNTPSAYFGIWWSAGDNYNRLSFYLNNVQVGIFTTSSLLSNLPNDYFGNPRTGQNTSEAYAFINFFGQSGTNWDKIVFSNTSASSNFESDNWTTRVGAWGTQPEEVGVPLPGIVVVPEPASTLSAISALAWFALRRRR